MLVLTQGTTPTLSNHRVVAELRFSPTEVTAPAIVFSSTLDVLNVND
jgi:hypothetical protein